MTESHVRRSRHAFEVLSRPYVARTSVHSVLYCFSLSLRETSRAFGVFSLLLLSVHSNVGLFVCLAVLLSQTYV